MENKDQAVVGPSQEDRAVTRALIDFIGRNPTAFHAVSNIAQILTEAGFTRLYEADTWQLEPGGAYYTIRGGSSLIAFKVPRGPFSGFMIGAAHSDSPAFKLKEHPEMDAGGAYVRLNVEKYGGMLMGPWFDRPLSLAGRLIVRDGASLKAHLVDLGRDFCMIPSLAIHMDRKANEGHAFNVQQELLPVIGDAACRGHLMEAVAQAAGVRAEDIAGQDLYLYARTPGTVWGVDEAFFSAPRLDDLQCAYGLLQGFVASGTPQGAMPVLAVFDNEEVGSATRQGAGSTFLNDVLTRALEALGRGRDLAQLLASSFMVSADNAHALHPAHPEEADPVNRPRLNRGIVIKQAANQKYTTDALSRALFISILDHAGLAYQDFSNRSDKAGGSTLGNISNGHVSLITVDIGLPQLAMHSPYETAGVRDTASLVRAMKTFFGAALETGPDDAWTLTFKED